LLLEQLEAAEPAELAGLCADLRPRGERSVRAQLGSRRREERAPRGGGEAGQDTASRGERTTAEQN
jgi:hypothetical protein